MKHRFRALALVLSLVLAPELAARQRFPERTWLRYASPEEAGFSTAALLEAEQQFESLGGAAALVVHRGAVVVAWGDVQRRYLCHSIRKSLLSALVGMHVAEGRLDLGASLGDLGIDDLEPGLTDLERTATVRDLLMARSGVYRLAAYEPPQNPKPPRGSHPPGTFWCYNNWDFNTLVTIFEQETGTRIFEEFGRRLGGPLGMEDYRVRDGYYHYEPEKSRHPAYPFRMSTRDLARFGLLLANGGTWKGESLVPETWVSESTAGLSRGWRGDGYGYMWWRPAEEPFASLGTFSALGSGGHALDVLPGAELVFVFRVDTFAGAQVDERARRGLLRRILEARSGEASEEPVLVPLEARASTEEPWSSADLERLTGTYPGPLGGELRVLVEGGSELVLELPSHESYGLVRRTDGSIVLEDSGELLAFELDEAGRPSGILLESAANRAGYRLLRAGRLAEAVSVFERNARRFPGSPNVHDSLGEAYEAQGQLELARESFARATELARAAGSAQGSLFAENLARVEARLRSGGRDWPPPDHRRDDRAPPGR